MAEYHRSLDIEQGYNFQKDKQTPVGFITGLRISGEGLTADQRCKDPTNPDADLAVVAVLSGVQWGTGVTDTMYLSGQVSVQNRQSIASLVINDLTNIDVVFQYSVYDYDPVAKKYFLAFYSNRTDMQGLIEKRGDELNLWVADDPSTEVQSPVNYALQIGIKPQPSAQALSLGTSARVTISKAWGLQVG